MLDNNQFLLIHSENMLRESYSGSHSRKKVIIREKFHARKASDLKYGLTDSTPAREKNYTLSLARLPRGVDILGNPYKKSDISYA